jgi:tetrahydromethanopterin S-methyltransferase subunit F
MTPEERAALFERTANYRHGYDDGLSAGIWTGRLQGLAIAAVLAVVLIAARYLFL